MKLEVGPDQSILLSEVFSGVGIKTDMGTFGICQRDGGIEVTWHGVQMFAIYPNGQRFNKWKELHAIIEKLSRTLQRISESTGSLEEVKAIARVALRETE